jgi:AraC-like DNA-binding protein
MDKKGIPDPLNGHIPHGLNNQPVEATKNANVLMQMPTPALRPFVKRIVVVEFPFERQLRLLPTTSFVAEFRFRGENALDGGDKLPRTTISGPRETSRTRCYMAGSAILLVMFTEIGAMAFLRNTVNRFFNTTTPMEKVLDCAPQLAILNNQLAAAKDHSQRIKIVESFLLERVDNTRLDPIVLAAVGRIQQSNATIRIDRLARQIGLSQSALERRFRRKVGASPKRFESIFRLKNAIQLGARGNGHDFTSIAHTAGYSDQSHFIKDFKRATGFAPSAFFRQSSMCKNAEFLQVAFASNNNHGIDEAPVEKHASPYFSL